MKRHFLALTLLAGLSLSQVPRVNSQLIPGQLYELQIDLWPSQPTLVKIDGVAEKTLTPYDPTLTVYYRATGSAIPKSSHPLHVTNLQDPLATESSTNLDAPIPVTVDRDYHAASGIQPSFDGSPAQGIHWYSLHSPRATTAYLSIQVENRDLPSDVDTFTRDSSGKLHPYREGSYEYLPESTQSMPGLASFRVRRLEANRDYLIRVAANHPRYTLRLRSYAEGEHRSASEKVRMGMDFLVSLGEAWHANMPRRGAVATRETLPHAEIQGCVACHPTVFSLRAYDTALANGYANINPHARATLLTQLENNPRPLPGHPGVTWARTIFSARAISARMSQWVPGTLKYLELTDPAAMTEEADGAPPNVSPFEIAYLTRSYGQIESTEPQNIIDLNWRILGLAAAHKPVTKDIDRLFSYQLPDGLFPFHFDPHEPGAEFITWHALYALAKAGLTLADPRVKRLYDLCLARQHPSGEWQGDHAHKAFNTPFRDTQFAVMALSQLHRAGWTNGSGAYPPTLSLTSPNPTERLAVLRALNRDTSQLATVLRLTDDPQPLIRFYAAHTLARWYIWNADTPTIANPILTTLATKIATEAEPRVRSAYQQSLYNAIDENEGYLLAWNAQIADEANREKTLAGLAARKLRVQQALAASLSKSSDSGKQHILNALWDHPQRHSGLPTDLANRTEVVLPAYFTQYQRGVADLQDGHYEPFTQNSAFRYDASNKFYKTRVGNDSDLPDLGLPSPALEAELLSSLQSKDLNLVTTTLKSLSVFPQGAGPRLTVAVINLLATPHAATVRFVFENEARATLELDQPLGAEPALVAALIATLKPSNPGALATLLPALARVTPGIALTRNADLQGRLESLLLHPEGIPLASALAAAAVFPHIADGPLIRATMLEAFSSGDRALESAAVEIVVKSYIAEPTNPVLGKQFADKAQGQLRRRLLDALDPARFSLRLSALNRYNPGLNVVLPEDANLFSSDVAQHLIRVSLADRDPQVQTAANELVYNYDELKAFRPAAARPATPEPSYEYFARHVEPILTKVNQDGRACVMCHATQARFPLRAGQSRFNYNSLLQEINRAEPKRSLLLLKPTRPNDNAGDPALHTSTHGGGARWGKNTTEATASLEYETILNWIRGAK